MNKLYTYVAGALLAVASLSSCSRSNYAFQPGTSPYHGTKRRAEAVAAAPAEVAPEAAPVAAPAAVAPAAEVTAAPAPAAVAATTKAVRMAPAKPSMVQRAVASKIVKQVAKQQNRKHDNAAQAESKAGRAGIVAVIGLVLLLLGAAANIGIIALIGLLAFLVGVIMLIIALING